MSVYDVTYETLGYTQLGISTTPEVGEYSLPKKGTELENNSSLTPSMINLNISLETHKMFHPEE